MTPETAVSDTHFLMVSLSVVYLVSEWIIRIVALFTITKGRTPAAALAWLAVIFFHPYIGMLVYFFMGETSVGKGRRDEYAAKLGQVENSLNSRCMETLELAKQMEILRPDIAPNMQPLVMLTEKVGGMHILGGNDIHTITDTAELIERLVADIDQARRHVHLLYYIFEDDHSGQQVADALARAAARGVKARLLTDAIGSKAMYKRGRKRLANRLRQAGVELYPILPVRFFRSKLSRMDLRNHRKLAVIDGSIAYTGSHNIVDASYGHKDLEWHDMSVRITGASVMHLQQVFLEDWYFAANAVLEEPDIYPMPEVCGDVIIQVVPSGPVYANKGFQNMIVEAIHTARRHIIITSPYLVPDEASLLALKLAVLRGVQVDVVVPEKSDQIMVGACARAYYDDLLTAGIRLYLYQPGLVHAKTLSVDDGFGMIGSGNFDIRSFYLNFELNLLFHGSVAAARIRFLQKHYIDQSRRLTSAEWQTRSAGRQRLENIAKLMAPVL